MYKVTDDSFETQLHKVAENFACGFDGMLFIGDKESDLEAALAVGATPALVRTGKGTTTEQTINNNPDYAAVEVYDDLSALVDSLLAGTPS